MSNDGNQSSNGSLSPENAAFEEGLLGEYLAEPSRVSPPWRRYFADLLASDRKSTRAALATAPPGEEPALQLDGARLQDRLRNLMQSFRGRGHLAARLDPLGLSRPEPDDLLPSTHGIDDSDLDRTVSGESVEGAETQTVRGVVERLRNTYCR